MTPFQWGQGSTSPKLRLHETLTDQIFRAVLITDQVIMMRCLIFYFVVMCSFNVEAQIVRQGAKISYDEKNYVIFNDINRREKSSGTSIYFGSAIEFIVFQDDKKTTTIGPYRTNPPVAYRMSSHVEEIKFADKTHIWVKSRLGHVFDGAVLIDILTGEVEEQYRGNQFAISPSGEHISYVFSDGHPSVFINQTMIFPTVLSSIDHSKPAGPLTSAGEPLWKTLKKVNASTRKKLITSPVWNRSELVFLVEEATGTGASQKLQNRLIKVSMESRGKIKRLSREVVEEPILSHIKDTLHEEWVLRQQIHNSKRATDTLRLYLSDD